MERCVEYVQCEMHFQGEHLEMCLSAHFAPLLLPPVLSQHPLKDLSDNPGVHRILEQSQVGMSFPTPVQNPFKETTEISASYFT